MAKFFSKMRKVLESFADILVGGNYKTRLWIFNTKKLQ